MLKLFLDRSRGSITVMVTLLLIPTIFFTGFLTDLARIKLSGNQAVMAADNYGEAILTEYDYLLKELYGLFAISNNKEGKEAIDNLKEYMKTSFNPSSEAITWDHLAGFTGYKSDDYVGCKPYMDAEVELEMQFVDASRLSSQEILSTQVGDFMRFRIIQEFMDSKVQDTLIDALEQGKKVEKDSAVLDSKTDFDEEVTKLIAAMEEYYDVLKKIDHYPDYIRNINAAYAAVKQEFSEIVNSDSYTTYRDYIDNEDAINSALEVAPDDRTDEEEELIDILDAYNDDENARYGKLLDRFEEAVDRYVDSKEDETIDFDSFNRLADELVRKAQKVQSAMQTAQMQRERLEASLQDGVTDELAQGVRESIRIFDEMVASDYSGQCYVDLASKVSGNREVNSAYQLHMMNQQYRLEEIRSQYMANPAEEISSYENELDISKYGNFQSVARYKKLYDILKKMFGNEGSDAEKQAKQRKKSAENALKNAADALNEEETTDVRSIPASIPIGDNGRGGGSSLTDLIKSAASYFKLNSLGEAGNKLLLKFYMAAYDYGMFSNRVTNVDKTSGKVSLDKGESSGSETRAASLTGIELCKSVNYLYGAELEYIYGGHKDSAANLNAARNSILAFRAVVNMTSTYTIKDINNAINTIRNALMEVPVLAIAVEAALRLGITALETAADWNQLKKGEAVTFVKRSVSELEAVDAVIGLLGDVKKGSEGEKGIKLDYNQYLLVMITFLTSEDQVAARTGDLITLNVNAVQQEIGEDGELSELQFNLDDAYTAVEASCTVHIDFAVMPDGFAKKAAGDSAYDSLAEYEKNKYKFTVTRGY